MDHTPHPLKIWRERKRLSLEQVSALLIAYGGQSSATYISMIERRVRRPSWELAKAIERASDAAITAVDLMDQPVRSRGRAA